MPTILRPSLTSSPDMGGIEYTANRMRFSEGHPCEVGDNATTAHFGDDGGIVSLGNRGTAVSVGDSAVAVNVGNDKTFAPAIQVGGATATLGFFGQIPAARPATPVDLAGVITVLQTLGLVAP